MLIFEGTENYGIGTSTILTSLAETFPGTFHDANILGSNAQQMSAGCQLGAMDAAIKTSPRPPGIEQLRTFQLAKPGSQTVEWYIDKTAELLPPSIYAHGNGLVQTQRIVTNPKHRPLHLEDAIYNEKGQTLLSHNADNRVTQSVPKLKTGEEEIRTFNQSRNMKRIKQLNRLISFIDQLHDKYNDHEANQLFADLLADTRPHVQRDWDQHLQVTPALLGDAWNPRIKKMDLLRINGDENKQTAVAIDILNAIPKWSLSPSLCDKHLARLNFMLQFGEPGLSEYSEDNKNLLDNAVSSLLQKAPTFIRDVKQLDNLFSFSAGIDLPSAQKIMEPEALLQSISIWQTRPLQVKVTGKILSQVCSDNMPERSSDTSNTHIVLKVFDHLIKESATPNDFISTIKNFIEGDPSLAYSSTFKHVVELAINDKEAIQTLLSTNDKNLLETIEEQVMDSQESSPSWQSYEDIRSKIELMKSSKTNAPDPVTFEYGSDLTKLFGNPPPLTMFAPRQQPQNIAVASNVVAASSKQPNEHNHKLIGQTFNVRPKNYTLRAVTEMKGKDYDNVKCSLVDGANENVYFRVGGGDPHPFLVWISKALQDKALGGSLKEGLRYRIHVSQDGKLSIQLNDQQTQRQRRNSI